MASGRKLGFWETTCEIAHDGFNGTGMVLQVARVHGPLDEGLLRNALVALQRRHPLLRSRIEPGASGSSLRVDEEPGPAPLRTLPRAGGVSWEGVAEEELCRKLDPGGGYPFRIVWIGDAGGERSELVMVFHHVIADGLSVMRFTSEWLALCARMAAGEPADAGPALPLLPPVEGLLRQPSSWIGFLARQMRATLLGPKATPIPYEGHAPLASRRTKSLYREVGEGELARLVERCQRERTTVSAALNAALMLAATRVFGVPTPAVVPCNSAVSVRGFCRPEVGPEHFGCYVTVLATRHTLRELRDGASFWALSRDCKEQLDAQVKGQRFPPARYNKRLLTAAADLLMRDTDRRRLYTLGYVVSNLGRLELPEQHGPFRVEAMYFGTARHAGDYAFCLNAVTLFRRMFCCFAYESPLVSDRSAQAIAGELLKILDLEGGG